MSKSRTFTYLGDGAYAKLEAGVLVVYTSDDERESNHVYLEFNECYKLLQFMLSTKLLNRDDVQSAVDSI